MLFRSEAINNNLQIGDYVICESAESSSDGSINNFLKSNIGKYVRYITKGKDYVEPYKYAIEYDNVPNELYNYSDIFSYESDIPNICIRVSRDEILFNSKNKEDLETIIQSKKYNL